MHVKFTKAVIDDLRPRESLYRVWDSNLKGFGVRISPQGRKTFFIQYARVDRKKDTFTIGAYGTLSLKQAQDIAKAKLAEIRAGNDPKAERHIAKSYPVMKDFILCFMERYAKNNVKPTTYKGYAGVIRSAIIPELGNKRIDKIEIQDISRLKSKYIDRPYQVNQIIAIISKCYNWAIEENLYKDLRNPCDKVKKYGKKHGVKSRERYLKQAEIIRLGQALKRMENGLPIVMYDFDKEIFDESRPLKIQYDPDSGIYVVASLMLLFFTGCRKNEILTLKWEHIDFEKWCFRFPDSKTGQKVTVFSESTLGILGRLKAFEKEQASFSVHIAQKIQSNPYVIKGKNFNGHLIGLQKIWERIRYSIGLEDVRIHDIRHTFASYAVSSGASLPLIGKILGHSEPATTARYAHLQDDPIRALNNKVSNELCTLIGG